MAIFLKKHPIVVIVFLIALFLVGGLFFIKSVEPIEYEVVADETQEDVVFEAEIIDSQEEPQFTATHIKTPEFVKGIYMTSWVGGVLDWRNRIINLIEETELNAIVIDIKDDTGRISYDVWDPYLEEVGAEEIRIPEIRDFLEHLHSKNIYVIGRVAVFQDPYFAELRPELAVQNSETDSVWEDRKGLTWLDAGSSEVWDYVIAIARDAHKAGFDEIQFDYVRFPSDGNVKVAEYPFFDLKTKEIETTTFVQEGTTTVPVVTLKKVPLEKEDQMKEFFEYVGTALADEFPTSVDLFGYTTTNSDDLGIGQVIEHAAPYFDFISPMVYPSHYNDNAFGLGDPNEHPYEIIKYSMDSAIERFAKIGEPALKIRPWLQDFDYPVSYTAEDVKAQIAATYDAGLNSWLLWDPSVQYTREALQE